MKLYLLNVGVYISALLLLFSSCSEAEPRYFIKKTSDFQITGNGSAKAWERAEWMVIPQRRIFGDPYELKVKSLYSKKGLYFLYYSQDKKLTATLTEDNSHLWKEDVIELFIWPDERDSIYFEYELSPLNVELPILVPNLGGKYKGWLPWDYDGEKKIIRRTSAVGGIVESMGKVDAWIAEFFIPYQLLEPLRNVPPKSGSKWRMNFYRFDYDSGKGSTWEWAPVNHNFHDYKNFGFILFE
ncbi:MAG: carbohydrate-binding family 9-like protein [Verrucomicrobiota bacterium]